ncbi:general odorant-binding protein 19d-like [Chironomus tepperi]|uniref:general odorant-binding protein 19d-like n=1 Tax=Chironomus tepperi TaxID=113505 RepID=UPI00391F609D
MKFLPFFLIGFAGLLAVNAMSDENKEMLKSFAEDCKKTENASDADVELMANEQFPDSKEGKCLIACMQEQFGVTKDGVYQTENVKALIEMGVGEDEAKKSQAGPMAEACANQDDPDRCEKGLKISKCLAEEGKNRKMDKKD